MKAPNDINYDCTFDHEVYLEAFINNGDYEATAMAIGWPVVVVKTIVEKYNDDE